MELFEQIRREYEHGHGTILGVAKKLGVHRRMVREALASAVPRDRKVPLRAKPKLGPVIPFIESILEGDRRAPRKQRHTAHRIWCRIREEMPEVAVGECTVRHYVHQRKVELRLASQEAFVPQSYRWGQEGQVDWYEAEVDIAEERQKAQIFSLRSMASGGAFHCGFPHASQQAFLEAHEQGFAYFGGVFEKLRYDNLSSAVKKILRGRQREETTRFIAFRSHWGFESEFCTPGQGHEKGGVEGEAGYFRRKVSDRSTGAKCREETSRPSAMLKQRSRRGARIPHQARRKDRDGPGGSGLRGVRKLEFARRYVGCRTDVGIMPGGRVAPFCLVFRFNIPLRLNRLITRNLLIFHGTRVSKAIRAHAEDVSRSNEREAEIWLLTLQVIATGLDTTVDRLFGRMCNPRTASASRAGNGDSVTQLR